MRDKTLCAWCDKEITGDNVNYNGEFICFSCWLRRRRSDAKSKYEERECDDGK